MLEAKEIARFKIIPALKWIIGLFGFFGFL
jgi:hypothetical protein